MIVLLLVTPVSRAAVFWPEDAGRRIGRGMLLIGRISRLAGIRRHDSTFPHGEIPFIQDFSSLGGATLVSVRSSQRCRNNWSAQFTAPLVSQWNPQSWPSLIQVMNAPSSGEMR